MESKGQNFGARGRLPQKGDPRTLEEIQRRTPRVAGKVELHNLPASTMLTPIPPVPPPEYTLPFHPLAIRGAANGINTNVVLQPSLVTVRHVENKDNDGGGLKHEEPLINGSSMWALDPIPEVMLAGDVSYNYLTFNTNELGLPTTTFNVVSQATVSNSTYHIPPDADGTGGVTGEYYVELFRTDLDAATEQERLALKWGGIFPWYADLWAGNHAGSGAQPFIGFEEDEDRYKFRTFTDGHAINVVQSATEIDTSWCARNVGGGTSNIYGVYTGDTAQGCAEFCRIRERNTDPQVSVSQDAINRAIEIHGNNNDVTITIGDGTNTVTMVFVDGLITSPTEDTTILV